MFPSGETGPSTPSEDLQRAVVARMLAALRARPIDGAEAGMRALDEVVTQYWWLLSHRDMVAEVANQAGVDAYVAAEVLSAAHRRFVTGVRELAEEFAAGDHETARLSRRPSDSLPSQ